MVAAIENFMPKPLSTYTKFSNYIDKHLNNKLLPFKHMFYWAKINWCLFLGNYGNFQDLNFP